MGATLPSARVVCRAKIRRGRGDVGRNVARHSLKDRSPAEQPLRVVESRAAKHERSSRHREGAIESKRRASGPPRGDSAVAAIACAAVGPPRSRRRDSSGLSFKRTRGLKEIRMRRGSREKKRTSIFPAAS